MIHWMVPWKELADPMLDLDGTKNMRFRTLTKTSFYLLTRALHKYGWAQKILKTPKKFHPVELSANRLTILVRQ